MFGSARRAAQQYRHHKNNPPEVVEVSEEELRRIVSEAGLDRGVDQVKVAKAFGSAIVVGDKAYKIKPTPAP